MAKDLIAVLKSLGVVIREPITLVSGKRSDYYLDIKRAYGYPQALNKIADELGRVIDREATCIATAGYGGLSPASVISSRFNLKLVLVRNEPKRHGKGGWIDGHVPNNSDKIAIIDDVFTTGGSIMKIIEVLEPTGAEIIGAYVVAKRGDGNLSIPLTYLLTAEELLIAN
jgi:orotate phosphoribosyltransferase